MQRSMTSDQDVFPALAGIAGCFGERTGYTYRAGMWLEDMHWLLL